MPHLTLIIKRSILYKCSKQPANNSSPGYPKCEALHLLESMFAARCYLVLQSHFSKSLSRYSWSILVRSLSSLGHLKARTSTPPRRLSNWLRQVVEHIGPNSKFCFPVPRCLVVGSYGILDVFRFISPRVVSKPSAYESIPVPLTPFFFFHFQSGTLHPQPVYLNSDRQQTFIAVVQLGQRELGLVPIRCR